MGQEIERKFLIKDDTWRGQDAGKRYRQGYLSTVKERTVRVRTAGDKGVPYDQRHYGGCEQV